MIEIEGPALRRGGDEVLAPFRLALRPGEVAGLVGPNGAGKTTLLRAVAGLAPERVTVRRAGRGLDRREIGHLPQAFAVGSALSALDCVLLGRRERLGLRVPPEVIEEAEALLGRMGLAALADRPMLALSGGQQQRVLIAQRLFRSPALLLLDEPTSALDLRVQLRVLGLLRAHAAATGAPVLLALHDLSLAARFCDRLAVVAQGRLLPPAPPAEALTAARLAAGWRVEAEFLRTRDDALVVVAHLPGEGVAA